MVVMINQLIKVLGSFANLSHLNESVCQQLQFEEELNH